MRTLKNKTANNWKIQFHSYKKIDTKNSIAKKPTKTWSIPKKRWPSLGLNEEMSLEQAHARVKQLNGRLQIKQQEERRKRIIEEHQQLEIKFTAALPEIYKQEFEHRLLFRRPEDKAWQNRFLVTWRAVQRMLVEINIDPVDWYDDYFLFYDYLHKKRFSFSYIKKIILITNLWGQFLARRLGQSFVRIPIPRGAEKTRLLEAYFQKCVVPRTQSDPLDPKILDDSKSKFKLKQYNWLYLSVWLGLRPKEIDQLKKPALFRLQRSLDGVLILWIYQTKLAHKSDQNRWKIIPILFKEQETALQIIQSGQFERPRVKLVRKHLGINTTLYGGRKGFTDLMLSYGQDFINVSQWLGHSSIEQSWRNYKSRRIVHYDPPGKVAAQTRAIASRIEMLGVASVECLMK